ncbi:MAG: uridylate kinase [Methanomicrobiales archaeon]|nr:uridylate kinase [Methanomicrobiales archaeon]
MRPENRPLVVKVGGSLFPETGRIIPVLLESRRPLLVVPGGGPFARMIRSLQLPDDPAHWMAVLAMDQFGWYLAAGGLPVTHELSRPRGVEILLPYRAMRERDPLPHSWDVTSDTIAAWVAAELGLALLLLKSVDGLTRDGVLVHRVTEPFPCAEVDPCLIPFALARGVHTTVLNGRAEGRLRDFLGGEEVTGTVIEPRI